MSVIREGKEREKKKVNVNWKSCFMTENGNVAQKKLILMAGLLHSRGLKVYWDWNVGLCKDEKPQVNWSKVERKLMGKICLRNLQSIFFSSKTLANFPLDPRVEVFWIFPITVHWHCLLLFLFARIDWTIQTSRCSLINQLKSLFIFLFFFCFSIDLSFLLLSC